MTDSISQWFTQSLKNHQPFPPEVSELSRDDAIKALNDADFTEHMVLNANEAPVSLLVIDTTPNRPWTSIFVRETTEVIFAFRDAKDAVELRLCL